jgi:PAS domain S-box-containing protein
MSGSELRKEKSRSQDQDARTWTGLNSPSVWTVVLVCILAISFYLLNIKYSWDSSTLTLILNIIFVVVPTLFIAIIASWSFVRSGSWIVVWLGIATFSYGLAVFMSMWTRTWASANASRTIFTIIYLIAGLLFFVAAMLATRKVSFQDRNSSWRSWSFVLLAYCLLLAIVALATSLGVRELLPAFFIPGTGSTDTQLITQGTAIALFLTSGLMILAVYIQSGTVFLRWYGLGLILAVVNAVGNLLLTSYGTPFNWVLRGAQLLAGVYLLMAAISILKEARARHIPTAETIADPFTRIQTRLKETEQEYRNMFENINEGFAICDMVYDATGEPVDYRFILVNTALKQFIGLPEDQLIGKNARSILPNIDQKIIEFFGRVASTREPIQFENYSSNLDKWFNISAYSPREGKVAYLAQDITERKKAEEALQRRQTELQGLFDFTTNASLALFDAKPPYTVLAHNKYYQGLWAEPFRTQGLVGKNLLDYVPGAEVQGVKAIYDEVVKTKKPKNLINFPYEGMPQGKTWWNWHLSPIIKNGEVVSLAHIGINVTEEVSARQKVEEQNRLLEEKNETLRESEAKANALIKYAPTGIYEIDFRTGKFLSVNDALSTLTGYTKEELFALGPSALLDDESQKVFADRARRQLAGEDVAAMVEYSVRKKDGSIIFVNLNVAFSKVNPSTVFVIGHDITERKKVEEERESLIKQTSETLAELQTILDTAPVAIWIARDPECRIITGNTYANELFKIRQGDNISRSSLAGEETISYRVLHNKLEVPPENLPAQEAATTGKPVTPWEMDLEFEDGRQLHMLIGAVPLFDQDGRVRGSVAVGADITELKKAENWLRESEERFRTLSNTSPIGVGVSSSDGVLLYVNPSYELILGYEHDELIDKKASDLYWDPTDRQSWVDDVKHKGFVRNIETRLKRKDGTPVWVSINVSLIVYGGMQAVMGTIENITKRKEAEEALRETRDYLDNLFNYANAPIIVWNPDFEITRFNHAFEHLTGRTAYEVLGKKLGILFPDDSRDESMRLIQQTLGGDRWEAVEIPILNLDRTTRIVLWNSATIYAPDKTAIATIAQGQDITQRQQFEEKLRQRTAELEASNKELEAFSYSVSHDLRAPLRGIDGFSDALLEDYEGQLDEQGKDYLKRIRSSSQLMSQYIDGLLKLSRTARTEMHVDKVNLSSMVRSISEELKQSQLDRNAEFIIPQEVIAYGDRLLLDAVLQNLLENAWKFTAKCPVTRIEFGVTYQDGKPVYYVKDNGVGFDMQYSDKLFKVFSRLHSQNEYPGTGIGLANVQRIIRRHGGQIWASSEIGKGTTFYFTLNIANPVVV